MTGQRPQQTVSWFGSLLRSPWLWGGVLTVGCYTAVPHLPVQRAMAERYLCGHPLEYATVTLFLVALAMLGLKWLRMRRERQALGHWSELAGFGGELETADRALHLQSQVDEAPARLRGTWLGSRLEDTAAFVAGRRSSGGLDKHLTSLAELAAERLHESYGLVRTITWAIPILGFLGTVMGITLAIANVTPDQLDTSLSEVTAGLAVAFDTTAVALALSLLLVFASFIVEGRERSCLGAVEDFALRRIAPLFPDASAEQSPLASAQSRAAEKMLDQTESLVTWQTQLWQDSLEALRSRWTDTLEEQRQELGTALSIGVGETLSDHALQLAEMREQFLRSFETVAAAVAAQHNETQRQLERLVAGLATHVGGWQNQLQASTVAVTAQTEELRSQGAILLRIVTQEEELARLEGRLVENLEAVRTAEAFEETLHSLNAAVHLLSGRTRTKAA